MDNGAYGGAPYRLPEKFGLADTIGRKPRCEVGVFFFGQPGFHNAAAVGCVVFLSHGRDLLSCRMSAAGISGASRKAGFGEGTPQQVSREWQNRRIADFGTVVETCSKTAADCPCPGFSVHRANRAGLSARCTRLFFLSPKIHLKGRQLPAERGLFKFSFALVIRATGFWQPAGQRIFLFTPYNTSKGKNDGNTGNFLFAS